MEGVVGSPAAAEAAEVGAVGSLTCGAYGFEA